MKLENLLKIGNWKLEIIANYFRAWLRLATKNPRRRLAAFLLVTMFLDQFVYPFLPYLHPKTVSANGSIEAVDIGPELFINRNPDFNVRFGDRTNPTKHKVVFESAGKELEMRLLDTQTLAIPASPSATPQNELTAEITALQNQVGQVLGEVAQLSDQLREDLKRPTLTSIQKPDGLADAIEQKIADRASIRYEILPNRGAKESIILSEKGATSNQLTFLMRLSPGIELHQQLENLNDTNIVASSQEPGASTSAQLTPNSQLLPPSPRYYFTDSKGKYLYHFEAPFMEDAANTKSTDVFYKIEKIDEVSSFIQPNSIADLLPGNNYYKLTLVASDQWLNANDRVYPVTIDPTIVHDIAPNFSSGTENRSQVNSSSAVESQFKELSTDNSTLGLWHLNESSGTNANDSSGNTNTGTLTNGPAWNGPSDSRVGNSSLYFDGVNDYVTRADDSDFDFLGTDNFTVEAWFKTNGAVSANNMLVTKVSAVAGVGYKLYLDASGDACFGTDGTAGSFPADSACTSAVDYDDSTWHHIAGVRRGTTDIRIYVDGAEVGTADTAIGDTATLANAGALYIGMDGDGSSTPFKGSIDEVRISRIARTPEEIAASANRFPYSVHESPVIDFGSTPNSLDSLTYSGSGIATSDGERPYSTDGLVGAWNFNETSGTTAYNTAGADSCAGTPSNCNLTLNNFASTSSQDQAAGTGWTANNKRFGAGSIMVASAATADTITTVSNPASNALDPNSSDLTIETWVKTTDVTAELFSNNANNGTACTSDGTYLGIDASGYPLFLLNTNGVTAGCDVTINSGIQTKINDGNWHHLVAVVTRGVSGLLYMDGKIVGSDTTVTAYASITSVGSVQIASVNNFDGVLDATRFYSRALPATEILSNYQSGLIEFQTRTGATSTPNDGTWEAWRTTSGTGDTQIDALDNVIGVATPSASIWQGVPIATSSSTLKVEGAGSLKTTIGAPQVEQSVVALWHLDETSSGATDIKDSTANANHGTPTGTTVTDGFFGKSRSFNGSSDKISVGTAAIIGSNSTSSVEAWIYPNSVSGTETIYGESNSTGGVGDYYIFRVNTDATLSFIYASGATTCNATGGSVSTGKWYHVTAVRNAGNCYIYINGALSVSASGGSPGALNINNSGIGYNNYQGTEYFFNGKIDEVRISNIARSADEIAEMYRAGRDHRIYETLTTSDLSLKTKLPFYVASDRPGTYLSATIGESAYANYETDANTAGLWHIEEQNGSGAYIKDASGNGRDGTPTSVTSVQGTLGRGGKFDGSTSKILLPTPSSILNSLAAFTLEAWVNPSTFTVAEDAVIQISINNGGTPTSTSRGWIQFSSTGQVKVGARSTDAEAAQTATTDRALSTGRWYHIVGVVDIANDNIDVYVNGIKESVTGSIAFAGSTTPATNSDSAALGAGDTGAAQFITGYLDEIRVSNIARTADQIRQAFEVGKRTHPITIDFKTALDSSNLITGSGDTSFAIPTTNSNINKGEKIIVKENVAGTEYIAQGTISAITYASGVSNPNAETQDKSTQGSVTSITVTSWDSGSTFPGSGFTVNSTVFKWQREYLDLTQIPLTTQRDAITRMTLRVSDGSQGATVYLDDLESADYSDGARATIGSTVARYFQYRAILTTGSSQLTPTLNSVTINYNSGTNPLPPKTKDSSTDFSATGSSNNRVTDTGSSNSPSLELAYKELTTDINTQALYHFSSGVCTTDSSGNAYTLTANGGMTCATGGKFGFGASGFAVTPVSYSQATVLDVALGSGTIEAWINPANLSAVQTILYADSTTDTLLTLGTSGQINFSTSGSTNLATANSLIAASSWYHIAATWTSAGHKIYVNGVEQASDTNTTTHTSQDYTTYIGIGSGGNTLPFSSFIDDVRITKVARTPEEIKLDAQRRPYGVYTSDVQNLGSNISSIDNLRWAENGVATGDGETPYSTNALVAQWNFNETSGTTAAVTSTSSCGTACNGTLTTMTTSGQDAAANDGWTANNKRWGTGSLMFDGTDGYAQTSSALLDSKSAFTIEAWIKPNSITGTGYLARTVMAQRYTGFGIGGTTYAAAESSVVLTLQMTAGAAAVCYSNTKLSNGQWQHIAGVYNGTATPTLYINGLAAPTVTCDTTPPSSTYADGTTARIGTGIAGSYSGYFNGTMDAVNVYSRVLSTTEILSNYQSGNVELQTRTGTTTSPNDGTWEEWRPSGNSTEVQLDNLQTLSPVQKINTANLVGYWKLDEVSGNRADSVGSNTLTDNATVTSKNGHLNLAGQFTSANSEYLSIADNAALSMGSGVTTTVSAWVYLDSKSAQRPILVKDTSSTDVEYELAYAVSPDRFIWRVTNTANSWDATATANTLGSPNTGTWYHVLGYYDGSKIGISINNGPVDTTSYSSGIRDAGGSFEIGRGSPTPYPYFDGRIDEVAMWKRVLTADERTRLYEDGLDKTNDSVVGGINRTIDSTTKFEGTGSEKMTTGSPQVDNSTVALWHLDETSSGATDIKDSSPNANNSTAITGTTVVDGFYGKARNFDGTDDTITIADSENWNFGTGNFALETWFKSAGAATRRTIIGQIDGGAWSNIGWVITMEADNTLMFQASNNGAAGVTLTTTTTYGDSKWHNVSVTRTTNDFYLYVDGVQQSTTNSAITILNHTTTVKLGTGYNSNYFNGSIDETRITKGTTRTADEIAESYRAGRDHRITKTLPTSDLSLRTKLPFYVAADRPGTYLSATIGESAYANYEPDVNTAGLWHLDEQSGTTNTYIRDSSGNGNNSSAISGTTFAQGMIGKARSLAGGTDYIDVTNSSSLPTNTDFTFDAWIKPNVSGAGAVVARGDGTDATAAWLIRLGGASNDYFAVGATSASTSILFPNFVAGQWAYVTVNIQGTAMKTYLNGQLVGTATFSGTRANPSTALHIGRRSDGYNFNGTIDEARISNIARTPDEIRQAYEIGKRTHPITIDFVTSPQAAYSSGTSVTINNPSGTTNLTDTLSLGDTIIFKENVAGTETVSQAVVTNIANTSSTYGTVTLLAAPTFPSGGFTTAATVFKWQREFFDLTANLTNHRDAITRITLRVTDGNEGRNVWIDDLKAAGPYLTVPTSRNLTITSTPQKYVQYRIIFSTTDTAVSPNVTSVTLQAHSGPMKVTGADTFTASGSFDRDGNVLLGSNNVKDVQFYDRTKDQLSYALNFDGTNDYVDIGTGPTSVKTVEFWVYPETTTEYFINLTSTTDYIWVNAGTVTATGFAAPIIYVNGVVSSTLVADQWQHVAVTDTTAENASNFDIGRTADTNYLEGKIDEVALYDDVRTATEVASDYNARRLGTTDTNLVALYHFDEGSGTRAYDSDGTAHGTLTNMATPADNWINSYSDRDQSALSQQTLGVDPNWPNGPVRQGSAMSLDGTGDYASIADSADWNFGSGDFTVDFWTRGNAWATPGTVFFEQTTDGNNYFQFYWNFATNTLSCAIRIAGVDKISLSYSSFTPLANTWYNIGCVRSGSNAYLFVNGVPVVTQAGISGAVGDYTSALAIGCSPFNGCGYGLNGQMDEVRVVKGAALYTSNYTPSRRLTEDSNTKLLLHFDEGAANLCSGGTNDACDASSAGHDAAFQANATFSSSDALAIMDNNAQYVKLGNSTSAANDKGLEIYAVSTTQFKYRWTGDQVWSSALNFSDYPFATPAQLGTTGVYVGFDTTNGTFGDESYFLIPSWAIQQFGTYRGTRRSFPERSYLVATDKGLDVIDADDNTLWMRTENGPGRSLATFTNNVPSSVFMSHGQLFVGTNGSAATGLYRFDFNRDKIYRYDATNRTTNTVNIAKRNTADSSYGSADTNQKIRTSVVNDVHAIVSQGKLLMATAMSTGTTVNPNIMTASTAYNYTEAGNGNHNRIRLAESFSSGSIADLYSTDTTASALERWNNVDDGTGLSAASVTYNATSTPALFATAQTVNDLAVTPGTSTVVATDATVYVAHAGGTTVVNENRATLASGSVKYYTKDYISEEMIGDIRGMWPMISASDASLKGYTLTNTGSVTFTASAVRGTGATFDGVTQYLSNTSISVPTTYSMGAWINYTTAPISTTRKEVIDIGTGAVGGNGQYAVLGIFANYGGTYNINGTAGQTPDGSKYQCWAYSTAFYVAQSSAAITASQWHHQVCTLDSNGLKLYVDGQLAATNTGITALGATPTTVVTGRSLSGVTPGYWDGKADEVFLDATVLSATQIQQMYISGREALTNKRRTTTALDTLNQLAGTISVSTAVAATNQNLYVGTNTTGADDGFLSRILLRGDTRDREYDESTTDPILTDNDINSVSVSNDGAYIVVGTDDQGITVIQNGSNATRLRTGGHTQGPMKRPLN